MRYFVFLIAISAFIGLQACGGEELTVVADFDSELVEGNKYAFNVTTQEYTSVEWSIEGATYTEPNIEHTFSTEGTFDVVLKVTLEKDGEIATNETSKSFTISTQYECIKVNTKFGDFQFYLYQTTPLHKENIVKLAQEGYYDGTTFHRIIKGFVIQGGDPLSKDGDPSNDGTGGPGYTVDRELNSKLEHVQGAIGAARKSNETASNGSQFYVVENSAGAHHLDGQYTVFGIVFDGMDVVSTIASQAKDGGDRPLSNITMEVDVIYHSASTLKNSFGFDIPAE
ncbi:MAG: peptidylprolyl isomerase [Bacteroidia bacterium]